ncbi:MAG: TetR/AcrR family transcriptional regulator [Pseudomonadota bacterium]
MTLKTAPPREAENQLSKSALRRLREKEQRRRDFLQAAETLFARQGFHQTSIEEIADLAEASTGAVYFHFKNKDDLLIQLMKDIGFFLREWLGGEFRKNPATIEGFCNIAGAFMKEFCTRYPEKIIIFFRESVGQSSEVEEQRKKVSEKLTADIKDVLLRISRHLNRDFVTPAAAEAAAVCVVGIFERVSCLYILWRTQADEKTFLVEETAAFIRGGVEGLLK